MFLYEIKLENDDNLRKNFINIFLFFVNIYGTRLYIFFLRFFPHTFLEKIQEIC